jgi:uncharacterized membrane protein HdeD (DUF308 family)
MRIAGVVLIAIGILMFIYRGFSYQTEKKLVDLGPVEINKKENNYVGWPVYAGGIAVVAGIVLVVTAKKNS